jgi:hypothetical protein
MIVHIVTFTWREGVTDEQVREACEGLARLPELIPALQRYRFGPDADLREGNADFGIVAEVPDAEGLLAYLEHPEHVVVAGKLREMAASRSAVQVRVEG